MKARPDGRRWPPMFMVLVAVVMIVCLVAVGMRHIGSGTSQASGDPTVVKPTHVQEFDPFKDGGDAKENHNQVKLAVDGNPSTAWHTVVYRNSAKLGNLKPGVGLVVDLGRVTEVTSVKVRLVGSGTSVSLWEPGHDASSDQPPMKTIKDWTRVAAVSEAGTTVTLKPPADTKTRHLLVYLTKLPLKSATRFQGGIADITVIGA